MRYRVWIVVATAVFGIGLALGLATPASVLDLLAEDIAALEDMADLIAPLPQATIFLIILIKNASAIFISLALSPFFCLVPAMALLLNGWIIGWVSITVMQETSLEYIVTGLVPHGIFEIPALIMGEAAAFSFGTAVVAALFSKEKRNLLIYNLVQNLKYLGIALGLLLVAAIIETFLTPWLLMRLQ